MQHKISFILNTTQNNLELIKQDLNRLLENDFVLENETIDDLKIEDVSEGEVFNYEPNLISGL